MEGNDLLVDRPRDGVLRLRLNRPERRNALDAALVAALSEALAREAARVVLLCSASAGCFCSGADLKLDDRARAMVSDALYALYGQMRRLEAPIVCALSGPAVGGGAQLAIASDLRVADPSAWLRFVGPGHGLAVGAWRLPRLIGEGRAVDLCLTGRRVPADEARAIGLVDRVGDDAVETGLALASQLAALDAGAVARVKALTGVASDLRALELQAAGNRPWNGAVPAHGRPA